jgi:hypothetical protein
MHHFQGHEISSYGISFAVQIRGIMLSPWHGNEQRRNQVWDPTKQFLQDLAKTKPNEVTCFFGEEFEFPDQSGCRCRNIFVVNGQKEVAYLGTVFNQAAMDTYRAYVFDDMPEGQTPSKMVRDPVYFIIPSDKEVLDKSAIVTAAKKHLCVYLPENIPVRLLYSEEGAELDRTIFRLAKELAEKES